MQYQKVNPDNIISLLLEANSQLDQNILTKVINFAIKAHQEQLRNSGEDYIIHPLSVALIIAKLGFDTPAVAAGILHDVIEDTSFTRENIEELFGAEITYLVDSLTKIKSLPYKTGDSDRKAENYRKLLLAITQDVRVVFIKIADRLHNMRTLQHLTLDKQKLIATETLEIYVPLANRFGLQEIKRELEDFCLKYIYPDTYKELHNVVNEKKAQRDAYISEFIGKIRSLLKTERISASVQGRSKHFWSIFRKKVQRNISYKDINDYYAIRVITDNVEDCYKALGVINVHFQPMPDSFKDYISLPKDNGYQSLHQVIYSAEGRKIEIQIRTAQMHKTAEEGSAAHWKYKEFRDLKKISKAERNKLDNTFNEEVIWLRSLLKMFKSEQPDEFITQLKTKLLKDKIIVKTPGNDYVELPLGSTPLDFAFAIHSDVGLHCLSARVNNKHVSLRQQLHDGDTVEIKTSKSAKPSRDWIDFLASPRARQRVKAWFRKQEIEDAVKLGKNIFDKESKKQELHPSEQDIFEVAKKFKFSGVQNLYAAIGIGNLLIEKVMEEFSSANKLPEAVALPGQDKEYSLESSKSFIEIEGLENLMIHFAKCCNPLPGDDIIGYITRGRGLSVHRSDCPNPAFKQLCDREPERLMHLVWQKKPDQTSLKIARLMISANPRTKLNYDISTVLSQFRINTLTSSSDKIGDHIKIELLLEFENIKILKNLVSKLSAVKGVLDIIQL